MSIKIVITNHNQYTLSGIYSKLEPHDDIVVVGKSTNGEEVFHLINKTKPDILLLDVNFKELNPIQLLSTIIKEYLKTKVIILSDCADRETVLQMFQSGARGYILLNDSPQVLLEAIHAVSIGEKRFSDPIIKILTDCLISNNTHNHSNSLTLRQKSVLELVGQGYSSKEIGKKLNISARTVNYHVEQIFKKLKVNSRAGAIKCAINLGLIEI